MIIVCPACQMRFMISASAIGAAGRDVRCAHCKHQWHAMAQQDMSLPRLAQQDENPFETESLEDDYGDTPSTDAASAGTAKEEDFDIAQVEALAASLANYGRKPPVPIAQHPGWRISAAILLLACALTLGLVMRESLAPLLGTVYRMAGYYPEEGISLAQVSLKQLPAMPREFPRYDIICTVMNRSEGDRIIPQLSLKMLNRDGVILAEDGDFLRNSGDILKSGESVPCRGLRFANPFSTVTHLVVDMGSPMELSLRAEWQAEAENIDEDQSEEENG